MIRLVQAIITTATASVETSVRRTTKSTNTAATAARGATGENAEAGLPPLRMPSGDRLKTLPVPVQTYFWGGERPDTMTAARGTVISVRTCAMTAASGTAISVGIPAMTAASGTAKPRPGAQGHPKAMTTQPAPIRKVIQRDGKPVSHYNELPV